MEHPLCGRCQTARHWSHVNQCEGCYKPTCIITCGGTTDCDVCSKGFCKSCIIPVVSEPYDQGVTENLCANCMFENTHNEGVPNPISKVQFGRNNELRSDKMKCVVCHEEVYLRIKTCPTCGESRMCQPCFDKYDKRGCPICKAEWHKML